MTQYYLTWQNVNVSVVEKKQTFWKTSTNEKTILHDVSGIASSNSLLAIMGSSGCGKTTLLNAISGRNKSKTGFIKINGVFISEQQMRELSSLIPQQDIFTELMTVYEHLKFMAALQLKGPEKDKSIINKLLLELSLEKQKSSLIKNLSGGEKRRLSLAGELINNPLVIFCDEPTTGLDSASASIVIQKLKSIANSGKIVLTTIHQPSSQLFHCFDDILLLAEGKLIFQGTQQEAESFFESINLKCPTNYNPADFYIKCITTGNVTDLWKKFKECRKKTQIEPNCNSLYESIFLHKYSSILNDSLKLPIFLRRVRQTFLCQLSWLLWRNYLMIKRNREVYFGGYFVVMIEVVISSIFYSEVSLADTTSVQNIEGFFGYLGSQVTFTNMYSVIGVFPNELTIFLREKNLYSSSAYFVSKIISIMPISLLSTMVYTSLLFIILKFLKGFYLWLQMIYFIFLVAVASSGLGLAFSATFSTLEHIELYLGPLEFILLVLSGLMVRLNTIPSFLSWLKYLSPFYYSFNSLSNLFWRNITIFNNCTGNENIPCYSNGSQVLQEYNVYNNYNIAFNILFLHILTFVFCLLGFGGILRKKILYNL